MTAAVIVSLRVAATPMQAFEAFTGEIGAWWVPGELFMLTPQGDGRLHFKPGPEGRLVTTLGDGSEFEIGRVTAWEPGGRLALTWRQATFGPEQETSLEVRFEPIGEETRITVEHSGWDTIPREHAARHGFELMLFQRRLAEHWRSQLRALGIRRSRHAGSSSAFLA